MKKLFFLAVLLMASVAFSQTHRIDIFPLGVQLRFQDNADQVRKIIPWYSVKVNYSYLQYNFGLEGAIYSESTGTTALSFENKSEEILLSGGYEVIRIADKTEKKAVMTIRGLGYLGVAQVLVKRSLNGIEISDQASPDLQMGLGVVVMGRFFDYIVTEGEFRFIYGRNNNPQIIPMTNLRVGFGMGF